MFRLLSWFTTKNGRIFTRCCVGGAALTVFGVKTAMEGPLLDEMKGIIQVYKYGKPRPFQPKVYRLIDEVLQDSSLTEQQKKKLKIFYVVGHEPFHAGGIDSPWGAIVGLPFFFEDMNDFKISELRLPGKDAIDWLIDGQDLFDAVKMSDNAKKFALMREIYSCNFKDVLINATIGAGCVLIPARFAYRINVTNNAFEKFTFSKRFMCYSVLFSMGLLLYRLLKDPLKHLSDKTADSLAAETGPEYLDGGIEYYKKILEKNIALEELFNSRFRRTYDAKGDENHFLFVPRLPTTKRLENLQNLKKEKEAQMEEKKI